jgi:hypothetical protein
VRYIQTKGKGNIWGLRMMFRGVVFLSTTSAAPPAQAMVLLFRNFTWQKRKLGTCTYYNTKLGVKNELDADDVLHI